MKAYLFILLLLSELIILSKESAKCGEEIIEHCSKCKTREDSESCAQCENNYFPFFHDLLCLPCNHSLYGQIGCKGNCNSNNYIDTRNVFCEKDGCSEGFYNLNGICTNCSIGSPGCAKCSYEIKANQTK